METSIRKTIPIILICTMLLVLVAPLNVDAASSYEIENFTSSEKITATIVGGGNTNSIIEEVPLYNQMDYPDIPYGLYDSTLATDGCGITCVAMIASYFKDEAILPDELAYKFNDGKYSNMQRMEQASEYLDLPFKEKTYSWKKAYEALQNGQVVISLQSEGIFTNSGHFMVLTGLTEDGKILVNDPNGDNWTKSLKMIDGFQNGFTEEQITQSGAAYWIYEQKGTVIEEEVSEIVLNWH